MTTLNSYTVTYSSNNSRFANFSEEVNATSQREAVEKSMANTLTATIFHKMMASSKIAIPYHL